MSTWLNIQLAELAAEVSGQAFSDRERDALACVESGESRDMQLTFDQEPGDVLFINNLAVMHRRDKYYDGHDKQKRMLYRMWINCIRRSRWLLSTQHCGGVSVVRVGYRRGLFYLLVTKQGTVRPDRLINPRLSF